MEVVRKGEGIEGRVGVQDMSMYLQKAVVEASLPTDSEFGQHLNHMFKRVKKHFPPQHYPLLSPQLWDNIKQELHRVCEMMEMWMVDGYGIETVIGGEGRDAMIEQIRIHN